MGRSKKDQKLFDELGEEEYYKLKKRNNKYYINNKEKILKSRKERYENNREKELEQNKEYYTKNKDKIREKTKEYRINNKEYMKVYRKTLKYIKSSTIIRWIQYNITFGNTTPSEYYDKVFLPTTHCNCCNKEFDENIHNDKGLDHIHLDIPFNIRGILCFQCNMNDAWRWRMRPDSIYNMYVEQHNLYLIEKKREYAIQNYLYLD